MASAAFITLPASRLFSSKTLWSAKSVRPFQFHRTCKQATQPKHRTACLSIATPTNAEEVLTAAAAETKLSNRQLSSLLQLTDILLEENKKYNLSGIRKREEIIVKHIVDALSLISIIDSENPTTLIDVGSGAGFPGFVLAIARPDLHVTLLDSVRKKTFFHALALDHLQLRNVDSLWMRAEEAGQNELHREKYNIAVARSVAGLRALAELCIPLVSRSGCFLAQKSVDPMQSEILGAEKALDVLGGRLEVVSRAWDGVCSMDQIQGKDDAGRENCTIVVRKVGKTPSKYPRRSGVPNKSPL